MMNKIKILNIQDFQILFDLKNKSSLSIIIEDKHDTIKINQINLKQLYFSCEHLELTIKYIKATQEEFDLFFATFSQFKYLRTLTLRFYNKRVQFLDSLFNNIKNIQTVNLDFKHFRKINLKDEYKDKVFSTKNLKIDLHNAIINLDSIENFAEYIGQHKNLINLEVFIDRQCQLDLLKYVSKQAYVIINFEQKLTKHQCDFLIKLTKQNGLDKFQIKSETTCIMLKEYLKRNGIFVLGFKFNFEYKFDFLQKTRLLDLNAFQEQDFMLQDQLPYLKDYLKELSKKTKSIQISTKQLNQLLKYMLTTLDELFSSIELFSNQFPFCSSIFTKAQKIEKIKRYSWKIEINENETLFCNQLNQIVYLDLKFKSPISSYTQQQIFQFLKSQKYLIQLITPNNINNKHLIDIISLIKQNSQQVLRYLAFSKCIYHLIPLPNQIFYDLIDQD